MSKGNLVGTGDQEGSCFTGSFIILYKSIKFNVVRKGSLGQTVALKVLVWGLEGLALEYPYIKVGLPPAAGCEVDGLLWNGFHL